MFKRIKTGPLPFNVSYELKALACKTRKLTEAELEVISKEKTIDEKFPRPTPEDVLKTLERITSGHDESADTTTDSEAVNELQR